MRIYQLVGEKRQCEIGSHGSPSGGWVAVAGAHLTLPTIRRRFRGNFIESDACTVPDAAAIEGRRSHRIVLGVLTNQMSFKTSPRGPEPTSPTTLLPSQSYTIKTLCFCRSFFLYSEGGDHGSFCHL